MGEANTNAHLGEEEILDGEASHLATEQQGAEAGQFMENSPDSVLFSGAEPHLLGRCQVHTLTSSPSQHNSFARVCVCV